MTNSIDLRNGSSVSRRTVLAGLGAAGVSLAFAPMAQQAIAQEATPGSIATPTTEGQLAPINGADLYYEVHGEADGEPVLLLHGAISNTEEFDGLVPVLVGAGYRTVALDARARGRSTWGNVPITYEQMAADALGLLDLLGIDKAHLVGWSQGGNVGLELAIHDPDRLGRVVVYGANFRPDGNYAEIQPSDQLPPFEQFVEDYQRLSPEPERFEELLGVLGGLDAVAPDYTDEELGSITVPVLVLDGAEEEFVKPDHTVLMAELIPGAALVIMPGTGHFAPWAQPQEFARIVLDFLAARATASLRH